VQEALAAQGRAALSGLGGVGKTQTVLEYAYRHIKEYACIFWVSAASRGTLLSGYVAIAGLLKLPEASAQDQTLAAAAAVKNWLISHQSWLVILDNADDLALAHEFIPSGKSGHVLLTTRAAAMGPLALRVEIQEMGTQEAALFLLRRAKCIAAELPLDAAPRVDQARAKEIAAQLQGLPLALDQAGSYIEETACGLLGYLNLYRDHAPKLLRRRGMLAFDYPASVATTWALSFERIEQAEPAAAELLRFCAFLHPDAIPEEVFREGALELGPVLAPVALDAFAWNNARAEVLKYSLLRCDANAEALKIHRLVQVVLKQGMDEATRRLWAERVVRAVNRAFSNVEFSSWALCDRLIAQAHACAELIDQWSLEFREAGQLLHTVGFYLYKRGQYAQSAPLYESAHKILQQALGSEHADVAQNLYRLGVLYHTQDRYELAVPLYERAREIRERALGPDHLYVAQSLNALARLYHDQRQYEKAAPLYERALGIRERALGPDHPRLAESLNNLAGLYRDQRQYEKAMPLYERALGIRERALGPEHPTVAWSLLSLAVLHDQQGEYGKAAPLFERALAIREKALPPEHPDVAWSLESLALHYYNRQRYEDAESLLKRALAIFEKALGPEHREVATCLEKYAALLRRTGRPDEAAPFEARASAIRANRA
jgi:tetratricopeptide (TPR) repeat protein